MKIGVLSDTHDRVANARTAVRELTERGATLLIHCGDICEPSTIAAFEGVPTHFVFGNNDGEWTKDGRSPHYFRAFDRLQQSMEAIGASWQHPFGHLQLAGKTIAWTHGDNFGLLLDLEQSGAYDFVFFGHTHVAESRMAGRTRVINPGALHRARPKTCMLLDLATDDIETIVID